MHVDAFFEYLRNRSHVYWVQIPSVDDPISEYGRDGVPAEEDLALRALLPETRPKRGRKRGEGKLQGEDLESNGTSKKRRLRSPQILESKKQPWSTVEEEMDAAESRELLEARLEAWAASAENVPFDATMAHRASVSNRPDEPGAYRERRVTYPEYKHSAMSSSTADTFQSTYAEKSHRNNSESAARPPRKNGAALSSAWRSNGSIGEGGKLRGRPPGNRMPTDRSHSTFPVNPNGRPGWSLNVDDKVLTAMKQKPEDWSSALGNWNDSDLATGGDAPVSDKFGLPPPDSSARLASTPSTLANSTTGTSNQPGALLHSAKHPNGSQTMVNSLRPPSVSSPYYADDSVGNRSTITNSSTVPSSKAAEPKDDTNVEAIETMYLQCILSADWVDIDGNPAERCNIDEALRIVRQLLAHMRENAADDTAFLINVAAMAGGRILSKSLELRRLAEDERNTWYRSAWHMQYGGVTGYINMEVCVPKSDQDIEKERANDEIEDPEELDFEETEGDGKRVNWKKKYLDLHQITIERDMKLRELKKTVLDGLLLAKDMT